MQEMLSLQQQMSLMNKNPDCVHLAAILSGFPEFPGLLSK